jgi:hypothetical protein
MNYELTIRQSFAKRRRILGSNFAGERKRSNVYEHGGEGGPFIGEEGQPPRGVRQPKGEILLLFISLFMVVTPSSWW